MNYTKIRENIWQIEDDNGVYCTLVKGSKLAILWDTGFGKTELKAFVEENVQTEYMVINSHGHPDHIGGNGQFDVIYAAEAAFDEIEYYTKELSGSPINYELKPLNVGQVLDLGGLHTEVVSLAGHTRGSIGLLIAEERLLLAGDAMNPCLWLFNYGALPINQLKTTLEKAFELPFDTYLFGHSDKEMPKELIAVHLKNIASMSVEKSTKSVTIGTDTLECAYEENGLRSVIVYTEDLL